MQPEIIDTLESRVNSALNVISQLKQVNSNVAYENDILRRSTQDAVMAFDAKNEESKILAAKLREATNQLNDLRIAEKEIETRILGLSARLEAVSQEAVKSYIVTDDEASIILEDEEDTETLKDEVLLIDEEVPSKTFPKAKSRSK